MPIEALLVEPLGEETDTVSDRAVITGPDVVMLICEDDGTVNTVATVGKEPVLKEVSDVEVL